MMKGAKKKITDDQVRRAHELGLSLGEAGRRLGVSRTTISTRWKALGLEPHRAWPAPKGRIPLNTTLAPKTIRLLAACVRKLGGSRGEVIDRAVGMLADTLRASKAPEREEKTN